MIKRIVLLPAVLLALSAPVAAQEATEFAINMSSTTTRAQVLDEFFQACRTGKLSYGEAGHRFDYGTSVLSRAQVAAETAQALHLGLVPVGNHNPRVASADEARQIRMAGERAAQLASSL